MSTWRLTKDIIFLLIAIWLISTGRFIPILFGLVIVAWYGYDLYNVVKAMIREKKRPGKDGQDSYGRQAGPDKQEDNGKITLTNSNEIKEAEFEKE